MKHLIPYRRPREHRNAHLTRNGQVAFVPTNATGVPAVFLAFDAGFEPFAAACVASVLRTCPGWHVHAFATNVPAEELKRYPWSRPRVHVHAEDRDFADGEEQKCYMNSRRFLRYLPVLESGEVSFAVYLDADAIVTRSLAPLLSMQADVGLVLRPSETAPEKALRACTVACRPTAGAVAYWHAYERNLPAQTWYADQLAMAAARRECLRAVAFAALPESVYSSFRRSPECRVLLTCTEDKLGFHLAKDYAAEFRRLSEWVIADHACDCVHEFRPGDRTSVVYVVFGDDQARLDAIRQALAETEQAIDPPGLTLVIEVADVPRFGDVLRTWPDVAHIHLRPDMRMAGVWQKEAIWQIAVNRLQELAQIDYAVFLDADCVPSARDFFGQVQAAHDDGVRIMQPWQVCEDTAYGDIGGESACYRMACKGERANCTGAQPGFCWSVDLPWLRRAGGFSNCEPLGGGDTLLVHRFVDGAHTWCPEATHMARIVAGNEIRREPPHCLPGVALKHYSHGPRANRGYRLRYQVAQATIGDVMALYEVAPNGLLRVVSGHVGDAWLRMLARRSEWRPDPQHTQDLWGECLAPCPTIGA